jgi:hypothetical protein
MDMECRLEGSNVRYAALWRTPGLRPGNDRRDDVRAPEGTVVDPRAAPTETAPGDRDRGRPDARERPHN